MVVSKKSIQTVNSKITNDMQKNVNHEEKNKVNKVKD